MIKDRVKKPGDKRFLTAIVAAALVLLTALYVTLELLINAGIISIGGGTDPSEKPALKDGEAYYGSSTVAYPTFDSGDVQFIDIEAENGSFSLLRPSKNEEFILYYVDEDGNDVPYVPPIVGAEDGFDYSQLFAYDSSAGLSVPKLTYLCVGLGILYFNERIELDDTNRTELLARYGLDEGNYDEITVTYLDKDGKEKAHVIRIGNSLLTGSGYYYTVDGRDYIYTSLGRGLDYALGGYESFLHSRVVATGLSSDGAYEPYLTTNYQQWKHTVHDVVGEVVTRDSELVVAATRIDPAYGDTAGEDGYTRISYDKMSMDLSVLSKREEYDRAVSILLSSAVGSYAANPLLLTAISDRLAVELKDGTSDRYTYEIVAIESVITDDNEITAAGSAVGDAPYVRVSYNLYVNGERTNEKLYHGVFDVSDDSTLDAAVKAELRAASVGAVNITYDKTYTTANVDTSVYEYVITDIVAIYDASYKVATKIEATSKVSYRYVIRVNGKQVGTEEQETVDLAAITEGNNLEVKEKLIGKGVQNDLNLVAFTDERYGQDVFGFITYEISEIMYFVDKEIITSFKFINATERDPFFGESLYKNTLDNENKSYALNSEACETVVKILGGVATSTSEGLLGSKTVAVGLTPSNMEKYGLYANSIYFELPRGISAYTDPNATGSGYTTIDSYTYVSTLGFYLYISDEQPDGTRYVGSDMYDIIVEMDGSTFDFIEHSFVEYWARRSLVMVNYEHIDYVKLDFTMADLYGSYNFDLDHKTIYIDSSGNHHDEMPESGGSEYDFVTVNVTPSGDCSDNALMEWLRYDKEQNPSLNINSIKLHNLYNREAEGGNAGTLGDDYAGTAYFKEQLLILFSTYYTGTLTDEEQAEALGSAQKLMSLTFAVDTSRAGGGSPYPYVYDFYRVSDRRVMVVIREIGPSGQTLSQVSDFYISQFAFRKIVYNFQNLLNGKPVDPDVLY